MTVTAIKKESMDFLKILSKNNNRDWFNKHKDKYIEVHSNIISFADSLLIELNKSDNIETSSGKESLFRIYRDVRFSKNKTPYNTYWSGSFKRATKKLRGSYFYHIEPGNTFLMGGFWGPEPNDMKRIRQDIDLNLSEWKKILSNKLLKNTFGKIVGEQLISSPRGYSKDHSAIDLLRHKQFLLKHDFTDSEVLSPDFLYNASEVFKKVRPFFNYMSEVLTTDVNGVPVIS
jgi:uncharacterized protein (TIGR02453 family)